jgi:DNA-binding NarL/FixJ family response regulator
VSFELINRRGVLRAVVVDAQPLWRSTLTAVLARIGVGSIWVCESREELAEHLRTARPHLVVLDPDELEEAVVELREGRELLPNLTIVLVSSRPDADGRTPGLTVAARLTKCSELEEIESALHDVIRERLEWAALTHRELEILALVADGASNREVARSLWLSDQTVKFHLANTYRKLGVSKRAKAVERARELGLLADELEDEISFDGEAEAASEELVDEELVDA